MATKITLNREFKYNGTRLPDPNPALKPSEVRDIYAKTGYGDLLNATVKGPTQEEGKLVYEFNVATGTLG
jgi:PRTRC genetic system protein C